MAASYAATAAGRARLRLVAAEAPGGYEPSDRLAGLAAAVDAVLSVPVDELDVGGIEDELEAVNTARRRLDARMARASAALTDRRVRAARESADRKDRHRAVQRARRDTNRLLTDRLGLTPKEASEAQRLGRTIDASPATAAAMDAGDLPPRNAQTLSRLLDQLSDPGIRPDVEARLLPDARTQDPVTFGRTCRAVLIELDEAAAERAEARRHGRRRATVTQTEDGMTRIFAELATVDGSVVATALKAFRRPDAPDEIRSPAQATADALVAVCRAALDAGTSGDNRNVRPHVLVTLSEASLRALGGGAELDQGIVPVAAVRRLLDDAGWSWLPVSNTSLPLAVTTESRAVPVGLWKALSLRDRTCVHETCDLPALWCDVAHLVVPYRDHGRLSLDNAALLCRHHHTRYDNGMLRLTWDGDRPVVRPRAADHGRDRPPRDAPARDGPSP